MNYIRIAHKAVANAVRVSVLVTAQSTARRIDVVALWVLAFSAKDFLLSLHEAMLKPFCSGQNINVLEFRFL
jgi:hypothetical protein